MRLPAVSSTNSDYFSIVWMNSFYREGMIHTSSGKVNPDKIQNMIEVLRERFSVEEVMNARNATYIICENFSIYLDHLHHTRILGLPADVHEVNKVLLEFYEFADDTISIINFYMDKKNELNWFSHEVNTPEYANNIMHNLHEEISITALTESYLESSENLLILAGVPGTGKSSLVKQILKTMSEQKGKNIRAAYVKDERALKNPELWVRFVASAVDVVIFDDLDNNLQTRMDDPTNSGNMQTVSSDSFVNQLLSFTDGVVENDIKIIITTNQPLDDVDRAIIRYGRCFDVLEIPLMQYDHAMGLWTDTFGLSVNSFEHIFEREDIMQAHFMSAVARAQKPPKSYLLNPDISRQSSLTRKQSGMGFLS